MSTSELLAPDALKKVNSLKSGEELAEFVTSLASEITDSIQDRAEWETRQDDYERKRYGIRNKKTFPWVGAANFILPQIDSDINRLKPAYINLAFGITPIVLFEPFGPEDVDPAMKREQLFDWRMRTQTPLFHEYCLGVDYALSRGFTIFKTSWKFETRTYVKYLDLAELDTNVVDAMFMPEVTDDILFHIVAEALLPDLTFQENVDAIKEAVQEFREGKTSFELTFVEKSANYADLKACDPRDEVTFPVGTCDLQKAAFIDQRFWASKNDIKVAMKAGRYKKYSDNDIDSWGAKSMQRTMADTLKAVRDGVTLDKAQDDMILMHETCTWYDVNDDGILERVIITWPDNDPTAILRFIENPYDHGMFPYDVVRRELNDGEIMSSRGIAALDDDFQTGISTLFNQDIDYGTIMNTPTVVARRNSVKNLRNLRYVPGQVVETENGANDYSVIQNSNMGQANKFNSMQYLKAWSNERIGNVAAAVSSTNNAGGSGIQGQKTAREVSSIEGQAGQLQSMDLLVWQNQMANVYFKLDALYYQFGNEEEIFLTNEGPVKVSRHEIQGKFNMVPNGKLDNTNPVLRAQKTLTLLQLFAQDPQVNTYELKKLYLNEVDPRIARRVLYTPEQMQANQRQAAMAQVQNEAAQLQTQLGIRKVSDALELQKAINLSKIGASVGMSVNDSDNKI